VHPEKTKELEQRIGRMTRLNQELAGCVAVLEGENDRLWRELEAVRGPSAAPAAEPASAGPADLTAKDVPADAPDAPPDAPDAGPKGAGEGDAGAAAGLPPPPPKSPV